MRNKPFILALLYIFFFSVSSTFGLGEKIISLGSAFSWEFIEKRQGITEASMIRPHPVLVLDGSAGLYDDNPIAEFLDLYLSFDEGRAGSFKDSAGHYNITVAPELAAVSSPWSRNGRGAALFPGKTGNGGTSDGILVLKPERTALFAPGNNLRDFSMEFWLYPQNMETGEQILLLTASKLNGSNAYVNQQIRCTVLKNRLNWSFENFFFSPGEKNQKQIAFSGPQLRNRTWSHHLIRFDADLGLLEYMVDGVLELIDYTTSTGREGGEVFTPVIGDDCRIELGSHFSGLMDEFRIYRNWLSRPVLAKYSAQGGRAESRTFDLGSTYSNLRRIEALGGRTGVRNEYAGNGVLRFSDHAEIKFFARTSNNPYAWNGVPWIPVTAGTELADNVSRGRYLQIAMDFYPGWEGESSPYLSEIKIVYNAAEPPPPPAMVTATAKNGAVELSWRPSPSRDAGGYMVYYGDTRGEYFGNYAIINEAVRTSPIDVGNRTTVLVEGLKNGTLYYFVVAAYNKPDSLENWSAAGVEPGEFSRVVAARPLLQLAEAVK